MPPGWRGLLQAAAGPQVAGGGSGVAWPSGLQPRKGSGAATVVMTMRWPRDAMVCSSVRRRGLRRWLSHGTDQWRPAAAQARHRAGTRGSTVTTACLAARRTWAQPEATGVASIKPRTMARREEAPTLLRAGLPARSTRPPGVSRRPPRRAAAPTSGGGERCRKNRRHQSRPLARLTPAGRTATERDPPTPE